MIAYGEAGAKIEPRPDRAAALAVDKSLIAIVR